MSGGPEYAKWYTEVVEERWRRHEDAAVLDPDRYCQNVARRAEMQFVGSWTALPIARNLAVRYQALKKAFMMVGRRRQSGMPLADSANEFLKAAKNTLRATGPRQRPHPRQEATNQWRRRIASLGR